MQTIRKEDIAIIGMSGRFPGASTIDEFWQNLCEGRETIHHFSDEEVIAAGIQEAIVKQPNYVKAKGILDQVEYFDAAFFGMSAREAQVLDPQHRMFLLCAWEALENAGYVPKNHKDRVGVFASTGMSFYLIKNILSNSEFLKNADEFQLLLGNDKDFLATRLSYLFNLQGPSVNLQTGCSSSLVTVHYACQSLLNGECDLALAGGVSITIPQKQGYLYQKDLIGSPDGHCYAFDKRAQGTLKSNGVGVVLLKPLIEAMRDHDHVYAVIRGTAINNDGANKVGYTAPSVSQQAAVIKEAVKMAEVSPDSIEYIETHGTGTLLGDPIEMAALKQAFSMRKQTNSCALASLKSNIGHLDIASGVTGLIKACLAVYHGKIPASINFAELNPKINLVDTPFYVNTQLKTWQSQHEFRCAGVSSFGMGGTNVHVVIQEPPQRQCKKEIALDSHLLLFSAKSKKSLYHTIKNYADFLLKNPQIDLHDVAYTLQAGREVMPYRMAFTINQHQDLADQIADLNLDKLVEVKNLPTVAFLFSGQGSQYPGMAGDLYHKDKHFKQALDESLAALQLHMDRDLRQFIFSTEPEAHHELKQTEMAQPALFAIEYALAKCYMAHGITPAALIGHSIGEYTAAVIGGIFTLKEAAKLIALRGRLVQRLPHGSMLAVFASVAKLANILPENLDIALINAPMLTVVSGAKDTIQAFAEQLTSLNIRHQWLHTSHAFHSRMLDSILDEFATIVESVSRKPPQILIASNVTGDWMTEEEACSSQYWVQQLRHTVKFSQCVMTVSQKFSPVFIEVGPGRTLQSLLYQHGIHKVFNSLPQANEESHSAMVFKNTLAHLWSAGVVIKPAQSGKRIPLPHYRWDLERYWIEPQQAIIKNHTIALPAKNRMDIQSEVKAIWSGVLGTEITSDEDHFFNLGGHSLSAIAVINRLPQEWQEQVTVVHLYQYPKFIHFVNFIESLSQGSASILPIHHEKNTEEQLFSAEEEL